MSAPAPLPSTVMTASCRLVAAERLFLLCPLLLLLLQTGGCTPYRLQGKVIPGKNRQVLVVRPEDSRLSQQGVLNAEISLTLDPRSMSPTPLGTFQTDGVGRFSIPVEAWGVGGLQEYDLGLQISAKGYKQLWRIVRIPPRGRQLLVILVPGKGRQGPGPDILQETLKLKDQLMSH